MLKFALDYDLIDRYQPPSIDKYSLSTFLLFIIDLISYCKKSDTEYPFPICASIGSLGKRQPSLFTYNSNENGNKKEIEPNNYQRAFIICKNKRISRGSSIGRDPKSLSAFLHPKRVKVTKVGPIIMAKSFYDLQRHKEPNYDLVTRKNYTISNFTFHRMTPFKTINRHKVGKYNNLATNKLIPKSLKYYFESHLRKMETCVNQSSCNKGVRSSHSINGTIKLIR